MAGLNDTALNSMANNLAGLLGFMSLHTADPGTTGVNQTTAGRQAVTWGSASTGDIAMSGGSRNFTGGAASGACTHVGFFSASSGGTFYGGFPITGDQTFNASGEYTVTAVNINGAAV